MKLRKREKARLIALLLGFLVAAVTFIFSGVFYYRFLETLVRKEGERELSSIADLKVVQFSSWRESRISDARSIMQDPFVPKTLLKWIAPPYDTSLSCDIMKWMSNLEKYQGYARVAVIDTFGTSLLSNVDSGLWFDQSIRDLIRKAVNQQQVLFSDLYRSGRDSAIHFNVVVPIVGKEKQIRYNAAMVLDRNPTTKLYPLLLNWPTTSQTGEIVILTRKNDSVVYLNDLRHMKNTALTLSFPLDSIGRSSVKAALITSGIVEGRDYRGKEVIAAVREIPGSLWLLEAKIDKHELFAPLKIFAVLIEGFILVLIGLAGFIVWLIWKTHFIIGSRRTTMPDQENPDT
jgi:two-component system, cell cycle sensor histidine kinase and response regulator CckA